MDNLHCKGCVLGGGGGVGAIKMSGMMNSLESDATSRLPSA